MAGFDRGVLPIGDWSMSITLSSLSLPVMFLCFPGMVLARFKSLASLLYRISLTSELLPDPETPVTQVTTPRGISTEIFFRLFSLTLVSRIAFFVRCIISPLLAGFQFIMGANYFVLRRIGSIRSICPEQLSSGQPICAQYTQFKCSSRQPPIISRPSSL